ncbi:MAG TPA: transcriptional repressor [Nitrospirota bacterium]|jgi:Fur family peroxide stress response transcriptional regulator
MGIQRDRGFKLTPQRAAIMAYLEGNGCHPSAEEIYEAVLEKYPMVSLATVYNTLEILKQTGKVTELNIDGERKHFDPEMKPHHHIICLQCKKIANVKMEFDLELPEEATQGYQIVKRHADFYGFCPACLKNEAKQQEERRAA